MMPNIIKLGQGDSENVPVILTKDRIGVDISEADILFVMGNRGDNTRYEVTCTPGCSVFVTPDNYLLLGVTADKIGTTLTFLASEGGLTIPFTTKHTSDHGIFFGEFPITIDGKQETYPNDDSYIEIIIRKSL